MPACVVHASTSHAASRLCRLDPGIQSLAQETFEVPFGASIPIDGKSVKASVQDYDRTYQDFVSVVSAFCTQPGVVIALQSRRNARESKISTVQTLLNVLQLQGACFSMDALHT